MINRKCCYFTEGQCEERLVRALKLKPALLIPGKVKTFTTPTRWYKQKAGGTGRNPTQ